jgi:hypothetical protein
MVAVLLALPTSMLSVRQETAATVVPAATDAECGDADQNGSTTVTDGVLVLRTAADLAGGCQVASRCDVDGNGELTVTDGVLALRLAAGLDATRNCRNAVADHSEFTTFSFNRRSAFGFCPPLDSASRVVLTRSGSTVTLTGARAFRAGTPGDPNCLHEDIMTVPPVECVLEVDLPDRALTADEVQRVDALFSAISLEQQRNPDCAHVTFDPCLIDELAWDNFAITDFVCGEPRLLPAQSQAIIDVLDSLLVE